MKSFPKYIITLEKIVGGGQALGTLPDGRKVFVWGGLPGEKVEVQLTKSKSKMAEAVVTAVLEPSAERIEPRDAESYLSTSPWQIMAQDAETRYKAALIDEAFRLHHVILPGKTKVYSDEKLYNYRNKVEFSWFGDEHQDATGSVQTLDIAFFRRGTHGKVVVDGTSLAREEINQLAHEIRDALLAKSVQARQLKTLLIRCDQTGATVWQLYVKDEQFDALGEIDAASFSAQGGEVIYSDPKSPASRITKRLAVYGNPVLTDTILGVPFRYATEGFFQVNVPVYEQALEDMREWVELTETADVGPQILEKKDLRSKTLELRESQYTSAATTSFPEGSAFPERAEGDTSWQMEPSKPEGKDGGRGAGNAQKGGGEQHIVDFYSGVGTIGLTIGGDNVTLVEVNEDAVREMRANIAALGTNARAVLAPSEKALEYITPEVTVILDPPRAGLHDNVVERLLDVVPPRIMYLSCNPVTQARDVAKLLEKYRIVHHQGYNFFPRTPHIEHLVVLEAS